MTNNNQKVPKLRFPGFNDAWEQRRLKDLVIRITRKNTELKSTLPLTISAQDGLIAQEQFFNKTVTSRDISNYYLLKKGDFAYNKSYSKGYPWGAIKCLKQYDFGVLSTLYIVFKPINVNPIFLEIYYETSYWYKEIAKCATEGARNHGLLNITPTDFFETNLTIPKNQIEQQKIGHFFSQLDQLITLHQRKLENVKKLKKGLLQKMFPKNGSQFPEIRFPEFTDAWEQRRLAQLCDKFTDGDWIEAKDQSASGVRLVQTGNIGITKYLGKPNNAKWISEETFEKLHCEEIFKGDILISRLPEPAGRACIMPDLDTKMITAVDCTIVRTNEETVPEYLVQYLSTAKYFKDVNTLLGGGTRQRISRGNLAEIDVPIPTNIDEQTQIGHFFNQLDQLITLHQRKLDNLKKQKKSLLQQMFV